MSKFVDWDLMDRELAKLDHKSQVRFALRCGSIAYLDAEGLALVDAVEGWLEDRVSEEEVKRLITEKMRWAFTGSSDDVANLIAETVLAPDPHISAAYAAESAHDLLWVSPGFTQTDCEKFKLDMMRYLWEIVNVDELLEQEFLGRAK